MRSVKRRADRESCDRSASSGPLDAEGRAPRTLYGRRKGHPLTSTRAALFETVLPRLAVPIDQDRIADPLGLFPDTVTAIHLEIGFGGGEHLVHEAEAHPSVGFIGCEPFVNGMAKALAAIDEAGLDNVRLHCGDAIDVVDRLPDASLKRVDLLYPDPWPKKRHFKRRFVGQASLDRLARVIAPGGLFRVASDIPSYIDWTLRHVTAHPAFCGTATTADDRRKPYPGWPGTRYEAKAIEAGRTPAYLTFERCS